MNEYINKQNNTPKLLLILGVSGSGKTTIGRYLQEQCISELVSHTTRPMRKGEIDGVTYHYVSKEEFSKLNKIERTYYGGNHYCLTKEEIERHNSDLVYAIVDKNGVNQIQLAYGKENTYVIYVKISYFQMIIRMFKRGDKIKDIIKRIKNCIVTREMKNEQLADFIIVNRFGLEHMKYQVDYFFNNINLLTYGRDNAR